MPHQCLKCGSLFAEGTTTILRGCPDCHGTRFFYTKEPLTQNERDLLLKQSERELPALLERVHAPTPVKAPVPSTAASTPERLELPPAFQAPRGESHLTPDGRLVIRIPKELRQRLERAASGWNYSVEPGTAPRPEREAAPEPPAPTPPPIAPRSDQPETVKVAEAGKYEIDVRRLLENDPIVIQKDGSYTIHLASLFESGLKGAK